MSTYITANNGQLSQIKAHLTGLLGIGQIKAEDYDYYVTKCSGSMLIDFDKTNITLDEVCNEIGIELK